MKYKLDNGRHSVYSIQLHLIICVKYRKKMLTGAVSERLKEIVLEIADKFSVTVLEQETDKDHIHILFSSKPSITLSKFINSLKSVSSRLIRKEFPEVKNELLGSAFWSPSYLLVSVGEASLDDFKEYVKSQGKHS